VILLEHRQSRSVRASLGWVSILPRHRPSFLKRSMLKTRGADPKFRIAVEVLFAVTKERTWRFRRRWRSVPAVRREQSGSAQPIIGELGGMRGFFGFSVGCCPAPWPPLVTGLVVIFALARARLLQLHLDQCPSCHVVRAPDVLIAVYIKATSVFRAVRSSHTYFFPRISTVAPSLSKGGQATVSRRPQIFAPDAPMQGVSSVWGRTVLYPVT
jgi:hypothetical protein